MSPGFTQTVFHDGTRVTASPEDSDEYLAKARRYGVDVNALSAEHEILHTFLAEALGLGSSPTLWAVAHGQQGGVAPLWAQADEEVLILEFHIYLNDGEAGEAVASLRQYGLNLAELRSPAPP